MDQEINIATNGGESESELHGLERGAYTAVLRTFCAQSSALSWGKEALLTELRNELRVSDLEHRQILAAVSSDRSIKLLREKVNEASNGNYVSSTKRQKVGAMPTPYPNYTTPAPKTGPPFLTKNGREDESRGTSEKSAPPPVLHQGNQNPKQKRQEQPSRVKSYKKSALSASPRRKMLTDVIRIRATDKLIYEVKRVFSRENPNPAIVEEAKLLLRDQEKALMEAINKLRAVSDGEKWTLH